MNQPFIFDPNAGPRQDAKEWIRQQMGPAAKQIKGRRQLIWPPVTTVKGCVRKKLRKGETVGNNKYQKEEVKLKRKEKLGFELRR
jgi:hypothetical protein